MLPGASSISRVEEMRKVEEQRGLPSHFIEVRRNGYSDQDKNVLKADKVMNASELHQKSAVSSKTTQPAEFDVSRLSKAQLAHQREDYER